MKKTTLLKATLALAVITALPNLATAQWELFGNNPAGNQYFGTATATDIRICTNNGGVNFNALAQNMIITNGGNVGIGSVGGGGTIPASAPLNKLLIENGDNKLTPFASGTGILDILGIDPNEVGALSISSGSYSASGNNYAAIGLSQDASAPVNGGLGGISIGATSENIGVLGLASGDNTTNVAFKGTAYSQGGAENTGLQLHVDGNSNSQNNYGVDVDVDGTSTAAFNTGGFFEVTGATAGNVGVNTHVSGDAAFNSGFLCEVTGGSNTAGLSGANLNVDGANVVGDATGVYAVAENGTTNNVGGRFKASDGNYTIGVVGEIVSPGSNVNYGVYGDYAVSGNNGVDFAGYFNGSVYAPAVYNVSDPKLKENIRDYKGALEQLNKLDIKNYTYKKEYATMNLPQGDQIGVMANNLKDVFPNLVKRAIYPGSIKDKQDISFDAVNTNALVPVLVQAVKELDAKTAINEKLNEEVAVLKTDNESLKKDIADVKEMLDKICSNGCGDFKPASTLGSTTGSESNLFQNVPNPFSNTTVIPYTIGNGVKQAVLIVTDLNGTELKRFSTSQAGSGTFEVNMGDLGTGTYIYSLFTDGKMIDTKKMILAGK